MELCKAITKEEKWPCIIPVLSTDFILSNDGTGIIASNNGDNASCKINLMEFLKHNVILNAHRSGLGYPHNALFKFHLRGLSNKDNLMNYILESARKNKTVLIAATCNKSKSK